MPPAARGAVAVVTVTYRSAADIGDFLASLSASGDPVGPVIVVDNPSDQSEETIASALAAGAEIVRLPENVGYGRAINAGAATLPSEVDYILVSNPDVRFHAGSIGRLVTSLEADPSAGAVGPKILNDDGSIYPSARRVPSLRTGVGHALFSRMWPTNPWTRSYRQATAEEHVARYAGWLSGSCLLMRRELFDELGGFDAGYFMYFEDVDLGYRIGKAGWKNRYEPEATVTHVGGTSTSTARSSMLVAHHRSADRFLSRKYGHWYLAPLRWSLHVGLELRARWITRR